MITHYPWCEPLALAAHLKHEPHLFLLYSGRKEAHTGRYSYLGIGARDTRILTCFDDLPETSHHWFGYLSYAMRHDTEHYSASQPAPVALPKAMFTAPEHLFIFDHEAHKIDCISETQPPFIPADVTNTVFPSPPVIKTLASNFTDETYLQAIRETIECIEAGDFYQANLTRKYYADWEGDSFDVFLRLCKASPAPYSAFLKWKDIAILSSSPECFLSIDTDGNITARPIKGSAGRSENLEEDARIASALKNSTKDQAENLMIVDLLRNDLARVSETGSVHVTEQSGLYSYATIHHLVSTIKATLKAKTKRSDVLKLCFPPGSMTGTPKIAAVEWCTKQERMERGVYSGAIGWLGPNNQCDFSVVIRTIVMQGNTLEFQVGGGIVADSIPEKELEETKIKARGICKALGIENI